MPDHPYLPDHWTHTPGRLLLAGALAGILTIGATAWAVDLAVHRHHVLAAITVAAWAIVIGCATAGLLIRTLLPGHNIIGVHDDSLSIQPPKSLEVILRIVFAALFVAGIAGVATWLNHGADFDEFASHTTRFAHRVDRQQTRLIIASVLALAIGAASAPLWLSPRAMRGSLIVTPRGVQCRRPLSGFTLEWNGIAAVGGEYQQGRRQKQLKPLTFSLTDGRQKICYLSQFGDDATELYCMIAEYHRHPELRVELSDGRAAQRLRTHDFSKTRGR